MRGRDSGRSGLRSRRSLRLDPLSRRDRHNLEAAPDLKGTLEMMDALLVSLRKDPERDEHVERIIETIEGERAKLLAAKMGQGR